MKSLQTICAQNIADFNLPFRKIATLKDIEGLPRTVLPILLPYLSASDLHQLHALFDREGISTEKTWKKQLESRWGTGETAYKKTDVFGSVNCSFHHYYMSKHVMDLLSFFIHRNPIDPKVIFTTRLDEIPLLRMRRTTDADESCNLIPSSMEDLYHYAKYAYMFHLYSQAQVNFLTENWKVVENIAHGAIRLIIQKAADKGYEKWRTIINFFIESGSVDYVVVMIPRLTSCYLRNLICCCAGLRSVPDNSSSVQQQGPTMDKDGSFSSSCHNLQNPQPGSSKSVANFSTDSKYFIPTMTSNLEEHANSDIASSLHCQDVDGDNRTSSPPDDSELKLRHDFYPSVDRQESFATSDSVNQVLVNFSESTFDPIKIDSLEGIGMKRKLNSDVALEELVSEEKVPRLNSSEDMSSADVMIQDLFDEALTLPIVSPKKKPSLSSEHTEGINTTAGIEHKNVESDCEISKKSAQLTRYRRGVKKFVLSHLFRYNDDSEFDAVASILCEVLQHWNDLEQFAMTHVYTKPNKLENCYVQLLEVLKPLVLSGQLTHLVLRDTKMPCNQYHLPLQLKRANLEMEPLKRLEICRYQVDVDKFQDEDELRNLDKLGVDYCGTHHLNLVDLRHDWDHMFMNNLLLVLKHDRALRCLTWHSTPRIWNEDFISVIETIAAVNRLEYLEFKFLRICSIEREEAIVRMICNATKLRVLNLSACDLQHQLVLSDGFIEALANSNIRELCLSENKLGNNVLTAIIRVLKAQEPNIKLTNINISKNCINVDKLLEFAEALGTITSNHSHSTILGKLTADCNVKSTKEQETVLQIFSTLAREVSVKVHSGYLNLAEFEAQM